MKLLLAAALLVVSAACSWAIGYDEAFNDPDGTFPSEWVWTGYSENGGAFLIHDGAFTHVSGGPVYYYLGYGRQLGGMYYLDVIGGYWVFAWRISHHDPTAGRCLWLAHDDLPGSWGYTFAEFEWENLDPGTYPDGQYMWHNGVALRTVFFPTAGPPVGRHYIHIDDTVDGHVTVEVDGVPVFDEAYEVIDEGLQGIGTTGSQPLSPAFDYMQFSWPDPVFEGSWAAIKALFR